MNKTTQYNFKNKLKLYSKKSKYFSNRLRVIQGFAIKYLET